MSMTEHGCAPPRVTGQRYAPYPTPHSLERSGLLQVPSPTPTTRPLHGQGAYPCHMTPTTNRPDVRATLAAHRADIHESLTRHAATNPRLFGSFARGQASDQSDVDILVDLLPDSGNPLMRLAGLNEELSRILGRDVDVVAVELLKEPVAKTALADAIAL